MSMPLVANSFLFPTSTCFPPTTAFTPIPAIASKSIASGIAPRFSPFSTMASPTGCSEPFSAATASRNSSSSLNLPKVTTSVTEGSPLVSVPVLSNTTQVILYALSRFSPPLMSTPFSAPFPVPTTMAAGVARPRAHGHAIIRTAISAVKP